MGPLTINARDANPDRQCLPPQALKLESMPMTADRKHRSAWTFPAFAVTALERQLLDLLRPPSLKTGTSPGAKAGTKGFSTIEAVGALLERARALEVFPLVYRRLERIPGSGLARQGLADWRREFRHQVGRTLYLHGRQQELVDALAAEGIRAVPLKGTRLAALAYGDPSLRATCDLDFYISPREFPAAVELLGRRGYRLESPAGVSPTRLPSSGDIYRSWCLLVSSCEPASVPLDLRWRILPSTAEPELIWEDQPWGHAWRLRPEIHFAYLCFHASLHLWGGLKWLVDLAHFWTRHEEQLESEPLVDSLAEMGLARIAYVSAAALEFYFELPSATALRQRLEWARPPAKRLDSVASPFEIDVPLDGLRMHTIRWSLRERRRDRLAYALGLLRPGADELSLVRLPPGLGFGYWLLRGLRPLWLLGRWLRTAG